jgi:hypothetical protein
MVRSLGGSLIVMLVASAAFAQTPQPFPRAGSQPPTQAPPRSAAPSPQAPAAPAQPGTAAAAPADPNVPTAATLGVPLHPTAQFLASYDAGRGQRYYIFGSTAPYMELVAFYRTQLKDKGDQVFDQPATHMFQMGRFRDETMAFPPSVTVKDWTWGGSQGYLNPKPGAQPARFPTVVMIVPVPPPAAPAAR